MAQNQVAPFEHAFRLEAGEGILFEEIIKASKVKDRNVSYSITGLIDVHLNILTENAEEVVEVVQSLDVQELGVIQQGLVGKILIVEYPGVFGASNEADKKSGIQVLKGTAIIVMRCGAILGGAGLVTGGVALT